MRKGYFQVCFQVVNGFHSFSDHSNELSNYRGSEWGLVLFVSVIWPIFLMFSVKICKILMFSVLKKLTVKCSKVLEQ